jgi:hypothetical protein
MDIILPISDRACPYGGYCIDTGNPSDCEINSTCFSFRSDKEKTAFDELPDQYELVLKNRKNNEIIRFKKINQLRFFLKDYTSWDKSKLFIITEDGKFELKNKNIWE